MDLAEGERRALEGPVRASLGLSVEERNALEAIILSPLGWVSERRLARKGHAVELLEALAARELVERCRMPRTMNLLGRLVDCWTLSPWGSTVAWKEIHEELCIGSDGVIDEVPRWANRGSERPSVRVPRTSSVFRLTEVDQEALIDPAPLPGDDIVPEEPKVLIDPESGKPALFMGRPIMIDRRLARRGARKAG